MCRENGGWMCHWFTACAPWLMTDLCRISGFMNEWKARKKEHCEKQPEAKTPKEGGNSRIHCSQAERQTKLNTALQETPQRCTGAWIKHTETPQHTRTHTHTPQCVIMYQLSATAANIPGPAGSGSSPLSYLWNSCSEKHYILSCLHLPSERRGPV